MFHMKSKDSKKFQFTSLPVFEQPTLLFCDYPGCKEEGVYKAPKERTLKEYWCFCLDHVRAYNNAWNYYKDMSLEEVEFENDQDMTWGRPTRPFSPLHDEFKRNIQDPFGFYRKPSSSKANPQVPHAIRQALHVMGLEIPYTLTLLKKKYKELAKQHHPDLNKGSKTSEEKLKKINAAYQELKRFYHRSL